MKDNTKYVVLIGTLITAGLLCVVFIYQLRKDAVHNESPNVIATSNESSSYDDVEVTQKVHGLYSENFATLRSLYGTSWADFVEQIETFCYDNGMDPNDLYCENDYVGTTNEGNIYSVIIYGDKRFLFLFETNDNHETELFISEMEE